MRYYELFEEFTNERIQELFVKNDVHYNINNQYNYELKIFYWPTIKSCVLWLFLYTDLISTNTGATSSNPYYNNKAIYYFETISDAINFYRIFQVSLNTYFNDYSDITYDDYSNISGPPIYLPNRIK